MASTRLTNSIRDSLRGELLKHAFAGRCVTHFQAELDFVQEVFDHIMANRTVLHLGKKRPVGEVVAELPPGWENTESYFKAEFGGETAKLDKYDGLEVNYKDNSNLIGVKTTPHHDQVKWKMPPKWSGHHTLMTFDASHPLTKRFTELRNAREDLKTEIERARNSIRATLDSVSTVQRLIVLWPEVEAFARVYLDEKRAASVLLPVIAREQLNETLGLPPGEKVAA